MYLLYIKTRQLVNFSTGWSLICMLVTMILKLSLNSISSIQHTHSVPLSTRKFDNFIMFILLNVCRFSKLGLVGIRSQSQQASAPSSSPLSTTRLAPPRSHSWCDWGQSFKYLILRWIILLSFLIVLVEKYCYQNERAFRRWSCGQFLRDFNLLMISWSFLNDTIMDKDKMVWMNEMQKWVIDDSIPDKPLRSSDAQSFAPDFNCLRMRANFEFSAS